MLYKNILIVLPLVGLLGGCGDTNDAEPINELNDQGMHIPSSDQGAQAPSSDSGALADGLEAPPPAEPTLAEDLQFLREEEKLARDVYITLYDKWQINLHNNISRSEQQHMDAIKDLLVAFSFSDPITDDAVGAFTNKKLDTLYDDLTSQGSISELDALVVGATIEDLDIHDIEQMMTRTSDPQVLAVYDRLQCGSRNHLRSFMGQLTARGGSYTPQFISASSYAGIINTAPEQCGP